MLTPDPNTKFILLHETALASFIKDMCSLGWIIALLYANHLWGNANWTINAFGAFLAFTMLFSRGFSDRLGVSITCTFDELRNVLDHIEQMNKENH